MIRVCFHKFVGTMSYPQKPPFDPPAIFPELRQLYGDKALIDESNQAYVGLRELFIRLNLDHQNIGKSNWNPLGEFVGQGKSVLIKPNLVTHYHPAGEHSIFSTICHPALVRVVLDYALIAVGKSGKVIVGDTPIENCDFEKLCRESGLQELIKRMHGIGYHNIELIDFRTFYTRQYPDSSIQQTALPGDPCGYTDVDLGRYSLFQKLEDVSGEQNYYTLGDHSVDHINPRTRKPGMPNRYHSSGKHIYRIPNTILQSDFVVSMAKLKTHKFSGVTLCLKNAVGICQGKEFLPHRRPGSPDEGGDSFPNYPSIRYIGKLRIKRAIFSALGKKNSERFISLVRRIIPAKLPHQAYSEPLFGDWWGNDTIWRTTLDLNLILMHADKNGLDFSVCKRTYLGITDGVIGMDHEAPMTGLPVRSNLLIAGRDPVAVDTLGTYLMGFDPKRIPTIVGTKAEQCKCLGNSSLERDQVDGNIALERARCSFVPTKGWRDHLSKSSFNDCQCKQ